MPTGIVFEDLQICEQELFVVVHNKVRNPEYDPEYDSRLQREPSGCL
jgi:hypothetical protein